MTTAIICVALLGALLFGLGFAVSMTRGKTKVNFGAPEDPTNALYKLNRAHGNAAEYGAMIAALMLLIALGEPQAWMLWTMWIVTAGRYLHAAGMITGATLDSANPLRFAGSLITYVGGLVLCIAAAMSV